MKVNQISLGLRISFETTVSGNCDQLGFLDTCARVMIRRDYLLPPLVLEDLAATLPLLEQTMHRLKKRYPFLWWSRLIINTEIKILPFWLAVWRWEHLDQLAFRQAMVNRLDQWTETSNTLGDNGVLLQLLRLLTRGLVLSTTDKYQWTGVDFYTHGLPRHKTKKLSRQVYLSAHQNTQNFYHSEGFTPSTWVFLKMHITQQHESFEKCLYSHMTSVFYLIVARKH